MKVSKILGYGVSLMLAMGLLTGYSTGITKVPDLRAPGDKVHAAPQIESLVYSWASSWSGKQFSDYSRFYSASFANSRHGDRASWLAFRKPRVLKGSDIRVDIYGLKVVEQGAQYFVAEFVQDYKSGPLEVMSVKKQRWVEEGGAWRISMEESSDVRADHATVLAAKALPALYAAVVPAPDAQPVPEAMAVAPAPTNQVAIKRFEFEGEVLAVSEDTIRESLQDFVGKRLSVHQMDMVAKRVAGVYQANGLREPIATVTQQSFSQGVVRILVIENVSARVSSAQELRFPTIEESLVRIQQVASQFFERMFPKKVVVATGY